MDDIDWAQDAAAARRVLADGEAFEELVHRYKDRVFRLCLSIVGERGLAEDMAQEAFVRCYRSLANYDPRFRFSTWLFRIAANVSATCREKRRREQEMLSARTKDGLAGSGTAGADGALLDRVRQALGEVPERYRTILTLRVCEGLSCQQIGEILQMTPNAVSVSVYKAKQMVLERMRA